MRNMTRNTTSIPGAEINKDALSAENLKTNETVYKLVHFDCRAQQFWALSVIQSFLGENAAPDHLSTQPLTQL